MPSPRAVTTAAAAAVAAGATLVMGGVTAEASSTTGPTITSLPRIVYDAHRGGGLEVRENSLSGMRRMLGSGAVQVLDLDTQELGDGTVVLMHDATLDRTTRSTGSVRAQTAASWRGVVLDTGSWLKPAPAPEPAPTLAQALDAFGGAVVLTIEAKSPASVPRIADLVRRRGMVDSVFVNTNDPAVAKAIHEAGLASHLWRSAAQMKTDAPAGWKGFVDLLDIDVNATDAQITTAVRSGIPRVWAHTLVTRPQRDRVLRLGVTGIITDDPWYLLGRTSTYPASPTEIAAVSPPHTVQVGDRTTLRYRVAATSSGLVPGAPISVTGALTGRGTSTAIGSSTVQVVAARRAPGTSSQVAAVSAGSHPDGRSWPAASLTTPVTLTREDLALSPSITSGASRSLRVKVVTRDSAATYYSGPGKESGASRTVLGLDHARISVTVHSGTSSAGRVVGSTTTKDGVDTGIAGNGDGVVTFGRSLPSAGAYTVVVQQSGGWYTRTTKTLHVTVR